METEMEVRMKHFLQKYFRFREALSWLNAKASGPPFPTMFFNLPGQKYTSGVGSRWANITPQLFKEPDGQSVILKVSFY